MRNWFARLFNRSDHSVDMLSLVIAMHFLVAFLGAAVFLYLAWYDVTVLKHDFQAQDYGTGIGLVFSGTGLSAIMHLWKWPKDSAPPQE